MQHCNAWITFPDLTYAAEWAKSLNDGTNAALNPKPRNAIEIDTEAIETSFRKTIEPKIDDGPMSKKLKPVSKLPSIMVILSLVCNQKCNRQQLHKRKVRKWLLSTREIKKESIFKLFNRRSITHNTTPRQSNNFILFE